MSQTVYDHVKDKLDLTFQPMGPQQLKNIPVPVRVYRIELDSRSRHLTTYPAVTTADPAAEPSKPRRYSWVAAALFVVLALAVLAYVFRPDGASRPVVAVLPFHDISPQDQRGLLSDPLSDGILAYIARFPELTVIARGSSFRYRDTDRDLREIGAQLDADYLLEGSLNFDGQRIIVNAALVDVSKNTQVWADQITDDIDDLMVLIADIGQRVAYQVEDYLGQVRVAQPGPFKADALLMTMKARRATMRGLSKESNDAVIQMNRETIELYPDEAWGHLAMAFALRTQVRFGWADDPEKTLAQAVRHGETAVRLDPGNYSTYFALGRVRLQQGDHPRAIEALERALSLNPSTADALNALAQAHFYQGRNEKALEILAESARIDPLPSFVHSWILAWVLWQDEQCEKASEAFGKIASPPPASQKLASVIETCLGNTEAAQAALSAFLEATPDWTIAKETKLQENVWTYETGRERWIENLAEAGLPSG
ncbi:tetratricopeptide repeat protein [Sulfitobacter aestuariivivens]|uniref:tetratricopeptide repeat protein n=1 Tax=Sulfitobacter aestuariivivens TaxID=2766981 RepID=UPI00360685AF